MQRDELRRRSRWILRAMEWDEPRARYPNVWHDGMPCQMLAFERVASRLRLGDLIAIYHPTSQRHADRSDRFVGISRVAGLRRSHRDDLCWIDLETAFRFDPPRPCEPMPRRVFMCCDPGWPEAEVALFEQVFQAAVQAGWTPTPEEADPAAPPPDFDDAESPAEQPVEAPAAPAARAARAPEPAHAPRGRLFAGADYSGNMRDPREATWLAVVEHHDERLRVLRLEATGRHGLEGYLRDPDRVMMDVEAIGLDFPFGLPLPFAESLLGGTFPEEGWWALARKLEHMSRPDYLVAVQEFRDVHGEIKRLTDERARAFSPLHRVNPDLGPMTFHGIRMIAGDRSRFALRPFESALGKLLLEVYPGGLVRRMTLDGKDEGGRNAAILRALSGLPNLPVEIGPAFERDCLARRDALDAVMAARAAAHAVLSGEAERTAEELAPGEGERVRREGWIYGLED